MFYYQIIKTFYHQETDQSKNTNYLNNEINFHKSSFKYLFILLLFYNNISLYDKNNEDLPSIYDK